VLSETFTLNQITGLLDRGHEVDIYAQGSGKCTVIHQDVVRYGLTERTFLEPVAPTNTH
jgi:colanic acid/amylovoran biosynthesis glycosyltransferase